MDAMAALIDAGLSGLRPTPSQGDAHPSGEPSPAEARTNPVTRLSYGPPTAVETPAPAMSPAAPMLGSPATAVGAAGGTVARRWAPCRWHTRPTWWRLPSLSPPLPRRRPT